MPFVIAVVDDDSGYRDASEWLLRSGGYEVRCYESIAAYVDGHDPLLLGCSLIDLRLGEDNGIDAMKMARRKGHDAPAILISAYGNVQSAVRAMQMGAFDFVEKPCDNDKVLTLVAQACHHHQGIRQNYGTAVDAIRKFQRLTDREREIYWLLADGLSTKTLAGTLSISVRTAEAHRGRVFDKMEARSLGDIIHSAFHLKNVFN
ncbi:MAG TPA: response regulator [Magnetospirillum sp.]|nr:response regulator [Magnetospirillum sp.]